MRIIKITAYASEIYRNKDGLYDRRSLTLEAEVESSDTEGGAIWELQRKADDQLESWIDLHRMGDAAEPPAPIETKDTVVKPTMESDEIPF